MKKILCALLILFGCRIAHAAQIVATVNDEPISSYDVDARAKLIAVQRAEYLNNKRKAQYVKEALDLIIDEKVKMIEAKKRGFSTTDSEINQAIARLEEQNRLKPGGMKAMLEKNGVPIDVLKNQLQTDLMWVQFVQKQSENMPAILPVEIAKKKQELRKKLREEEFFVFEILVPGIKEAEECYAALRSGEAFDTIALKYSKAPSKENGGEVGWIKPDHYSAEITQVLRASNIGDLSAPLKIKDGYLILLLQDKKTPVYTDAISIWELAQMAISPQEVSQYETALQALNSCEAFMSFAKEHAIPESIRNGMVSPDQMPNELKEILSKGQLKTVIGPVKMQNADVFFMKCGIQTKQILPSDDMIKNQIENEKMELLSEKLLRNAKRYVVIEKKTGKGGK